VEKTKKTYPTGDLRSLVFNYRNLDELTSVRCSLGSKDVQLQFRRGSDFELPCKLGTHDLGSSKLIRLCSVEFLLHQFHLDGLALSKGGLNEYGEHAQCHDQFFHLLFPFTRQNLTAALFPSVPRIRCPSVASFALVSRRFEGVSLT